MALALGDGQLGDGHLGTIGTWQQALGTGSLAELAHNTGLDESSCSGDLLGTVKT